MAFCGMLFKKLLFGTLLSAAVAGPETKPSCNRKCGSVSISYTFGTSKDCCLAPSFLITCNYKFVHPKPFLGNGNLELLDVSFDGELRVSNLVDRRCDNGDFLKHLFNAGKFAASSKKNKFTAVGCNTFAYIEGRTALKDFTTGSVVSGSCNGIGCCQSSIPENIILFNVSVGTLDIGFIVQSFNPFSFGFRVEEAAYNFSSLDLLDLRKQTKVAMVLDWAVEDKTCSDAQKNQTNYACKAASSECYSTIGNLGYFAIAPKAVTGTLTCPAVAKGLMSAKVQTPAVRDNNASIRMEIQGRLSMCLSPGVRR